MTKRNNRAAGIGRGGRVMLAAALPFRAGCLRECATAFARTFIPLLLVLALMTLGFAHRHVPTPMTPELAAYIAAGGQLSDICTSSNEGDITTHTECEACRISDTMQWAPCQTDGSDTVVFEVRSFVARRIVERHELDPNRLTRGPPKV